MGFWDNVFGGEEWRQRELERLKRENERKELIDAIKSNVDGKHDSGKYEIIKKAFPEKGFSGAYLEDCERLFKDERLMDKILENKNLAHRICNYVERHVMEIPGSNTVFAELQDKFYEFKKQVDGKYGGHDRQKHNNQHNHQHNNRQSESPLIDAIKSNVEQRKDPNKYEIIRNAFPDYGSHKASTEDLQSIFKDKKLMNDILGNRNLAYRICKCVERSSNENLPLELKNNFKEFKAQLENRYNRFVVGDLKPGHTPPGNGNNKGGAAAIK